MSGEMHELPGILRAYREDDFGLQARAEFFYKTAIIMAVGMLIVIFYTSFHQLNSPDYGHLYLPVLLPEILIFLLILLSIFLLIRGRFRLSSHILVASSYLAIWAILFLDKSHTITRYDTVVYIFAISSMLPLILKRGKISMMIYIGMNILMTGIFIYFSGSRQEMSVPTMAEFFLDMLVSLIFTGIVGYKIFTINRNAHHRAINDLKERHEAEKSLLSSETKYRTLFENAQIGIYQTTPAGEILNVNPAILQMLGFNTIDELRQINLESGSLHAYGGREEFKDLMHKNGVVRNLESKWRKKNGDLIDIIENAKAVRDTDGEIIYYDGFVENITERKRAERELLESRQQYQTLAQISPVGIFRTDSEGKTTYVNPKWTELSGLRLEDAVGDGWLKAVHPDDRAGLVNNWNTDYTNKRKSVAEYRFLKPDGKVNWVLGNAVPEIINNEIKGYVGTITNITEIKDAQLSLERSEKKFRDLADLLPQTVWESTMEGNLTYVNKYGIKLFGLNEEDINGYLDIFTFILPDERARAQIYIRNVVIQSSQGLEGEEFTGLKKDGSSFPIKTFIAVIYEEGIPAGLRSIVIDMSEIKKAEDELKESEARYRSIIEAFPDIIMISDLQGDIIFGNEALERITGMVPEDYRNQNRKQMIHPDDREIVASAIRELLTNGKKHSGIIENRFIDSWGKVHWFSGIISRIVINGQTMLQTITRDISEKKANEIELDNYRNRLESLVKERTDELEAALEEYIAVNEKLVEQHEKLEQTLENLRQTQKQLVKSEKLASLGILAAGVAHEINNPLNFIQGGINGLETYFEDNLENHFMDIKPLLEGMNEGVRRAANIVASLSHYSRQSEIPMTLCDIHIIIDNCLVLLHNQIKNRIIIDKDYTKEPFELTCNEGKIHQAILNLLANSVQSIGKEGTISIRTSLAGEKLELVIADNGHGISEENISRIFDPFFTTKEPGKGTGLGLSITYNIILEHTGEINCSSKLNEGTQFVIYLPVRIL